MLDTADMEPLAMSMTEDPNKVTRLPAPRKCPAITAVLELGMPADREGGQSTGIA
jgi:hypothetical protein